MVINQGSKNIYCSSCGGPVPLNEAICEVCRRKKRKKLRMSFTKSREAEALLDQERIKIIRGLHPDKLTPDPEPIYKEPIIQYRNCPSCKTRLPVSINKFIFCPFCKELLP